MFFRQRKKSRLPSLFICVLSLLFLAFSGRGQIRFDSWTTDNGLPQNSVRTIVRTRDGYLWMGTFEGLVRFDGVNFTVFNLGNTPELKSNYVRALIEDRQGNLWIGIDGGGLVRYRDNRFFHYTEAEGLGNINITSLLEDQGENLWIATEGEGIFVFKDGKFTNYTTKDGLPGNDVWAFAENKSGGVWFGTKGGVSLLKDEKIETLGVKDGLNGNWVQSLKNDERNGLWIGTTEGVNLLKDGKFVKFEAQKALAGKNVQVLQPDHEGNIWAGTINRGLYKIGKDAFESAEAVGKPDERIEAIYEDSENQLWIGTSVNGLQKLRSDYFQVFMPSEDAEDASISAVLEDRQKTLWFASQTKLYRLNNGVIENIAPEVNFGAIRSLAEDKDGNLWIGANGLYKYENGKLKVYTPRDGLSENHVVSVICDREGNIWAGTYNGLNLFKDGKFTVFRKENGLADIFIHGLFEDSRGAIWIGSRGGVSRYQDGRFTNLTTENGLANNRVETFYEDRDGSLWIGTTGGLNRFGNGRFSTVTTRDGLYDNLAFQIVEDDAGNFWMSSNRGIYRAKRSELDDFADGKIQKINSFFYGTADGMLSRECNGGEPAGIKDRAGNIYFASVKGLVKIDPKLKNENPPPVILERVLIDGKIQPPEEMPEIKPEQENLEINYTAISWQRPSEIRFRYKLEGLDQDWSEVGTRRVAYFSHLPPGEYTFRVIADNGEGVWNLEGKSVRIRVFPPFYRTWWFLVICALAISGAVFFIFKIRLNQVERARSAQEEFSRRLINAHEAERRRVAAELHDSIGQTLAMIKNRATFGIDADDGAGAKEQLVAIASQTTQAIGEVREISYNLRPYLLESLGLTKAVKSLVKKIEEVQLLTIDAQIDDVGNLFAPEAEMSVYRIIQESLNNVAKHAEADEAVLKIEKNGELVVIKISDDGCGFDLNAPPKKEAEKGGFGLLGISERVRMLGGTLDIQTAPGKGTIITIKITPKKKIAV